MRFLHTADLHIDSPLHGLATQDEAMLQRVHGATRAALEQMVELAIDQRVGLFVIAGDLFDGDWKEMRTGQWVASQFRKLQEAGIEICAIRGNHDAVSQIQKRVRWPENYFEFSATHAETHLYDQLGVAVHGQSFAERKVLNDLAADYPAALSDYFNIGVLHTSLTGNPNHDTYAPTSIEVLKTKGYQYWALGHIHLRNVEPLCRDPYVAYSGIPQGRHIRETGEKGCLIGDVDGTELRQVTFHAVDSLRWQRLSISVDNFSTFEEMLARASELLEQTHRDHEGRSSAVRLEFEGQTKLHDQLSDILQRPQFIQEIREVAAVVSDELWIEKVKFNTSPPPGSSQRKQHELWEAVAQQFRQLHQEDGGVSSLADLTKPLLTKLAAEQIQLDGELSIDQRLEAWVQAAEDLLRHELGADNK